MTALGNDTVIELHNLNGRGRLKRNYDDAIYSSIDAFADLVFTDTDSITFAIERGQGGTRQGMWRAEYPLPSGFNWLHEVQVQKRRPIETHGTGYLRTWRALGDATARTRLAQGFKVDQDSYVEFISVYMAKVGSPTGNLTMTVETDSSDTPSGTTVTYGTSDTVDGSTLGERAAWRVFRFDPPMLLTAATQYHWTLQRSNSVDSSNYWRCGEDSNAGYPDGALSERDASTWTADSTTDLLFSVGLAGHEWTPLARIFYDYVPGTTDNLRLRLGSLGFVCEGAVVRLTGGASIARPTAETSTLAVRPEIIEAMALHLLRAGRAGTQSADNNAQAAQAILQRFGVLPGAQRMLPAKAIRVYGST